jgi:2-methylfumaryl-CoA isomerase
MRSATPVVSAPRPILEGLRVVELSAFVAAPLGGTTLASLGADVVRIDPVGGGMDAHRWPEHNGESLYWAGLNQGKRSVTIDTRDPKGEALVVQLAAKAGILLTNLPVRGALAYERLIAARPDLIMVAITGAFDGSIAVDYTVNASLGFPWVTGPEGYEAPVNHVLPAWDALTGYLAATGILAAELRRRTSGEGQLITLSLADVALSIAGNLGLIGEAELVTESRGRYGNHLFGSFARDFRTRDGRYAIVVALTQRQWRSLVKATGIEDAVALIERGGPHLDDEGDRFASRHQICAALEPWFASHTLAEVERIFNEANVLWGPYRTFKELMHHELSRPIRNPILREVDQPGIGTYHRAASPLDFSGAPRVPAARSPGMGEHTKVVLMSWLGLSSADVDTLTSEGVVA